jgi:hypothetical protein
LSCSFEALQEDGFGALIRAKRRSMVVAELAAIAIRVFKRNRVLEQNRKLAASTADLQSPVKN